MYKSMLDFENDDDNFARYSFRPTMIIKKKEKNF